MYHHLKTAEVLKKLDSSEDGLTSKEAESRLVDIGPNRLSEPQGRSYAAVFLEQFKSVLIIILLVASVISLFVGEIADCIVIFAIVILNAALGFYLEVKAEKSIKSLKKLLSLKTKVLRDGVVTSIDSELLVPGDIVILESGVKVPADLRITDSVDIRVDESALTGESVPVAKTSKALPEETPLAERANSAFMGTIVTSGSGTGIVAFTGMNTEFGKIADLAQSTETEDTPLKKKLDSLGRILGAISLAIAFGIFLLGWFQHRGLFEMFFLAISLAVAVIPEGLPAVVTITLALGVRNMVKKNCLVRNLSATESLGEVSVICTDKTGTLTQNEMTVRKILFSGDIYDVTGKGYEPEGEFSINGEPADPADVPGLHELIKAGVLCNHAVVRKQENRWISIGAPTESALITLGMKAGVTRKNAHEGAVLARELGFTSSRKRMTSVYESDVGFTAYCKGAPEQILARSVNLAEKSSEVPMNEELRDSLMKKYHELAGNGLRILALGRRRLETLDLPDEELEKELTFLGFVCISDPPRPEVAEAVSLAGRAGIDVIMMTGDSPVTALSIGKEVGIVSGGVITGNDLDSMSDHELLEKLRDHRVFARVSPEHKFRIVELLQGLEKVVAMTGDGVNDAPALKKADVGIAMGIKGTDVAKDASDMILMDDNFASIVGGVEEGRRQYENIQRFTRFLLSANFGEIVTIVAAMLLKLPVILFAVQILWINLATDGVLALALGTDPAEKGSMEHPPRNSHNPILSGRVMAFLLSLGLWIGGLTVGIFWYLIQQGEPVDEARSTAFIGLIIFEMVHMFNFREINTSVFKKHYLDNSFLNISWLVTFALQLVIIYTPMAQKMFYTVSMRLTDWLWIAFLSLTIILMTEIYRLASKSRL